MTFCIQHRLSDKQPLCKHPEREIFGTFRTDLFQWLRVPVREEEEIKSFLRVKFKISNIFQLLFYKFHVCVGPG